MSAVNSSLDSMPQLALFEIDAKAQGHADMNVDTLGEAYCLANNALTRRSQGITLTPAWLVERMLDEVADDGFDTIIDCGAGTGRFAIAAARRFPTARVIAVEQNSDLATLLRQRLWECGLLGRVDIIAGDFRSVTIPTSGKTLFLGNPPYVRHHDIGVSWKGWYAQRMAAFGRVASKLAGLHVHFMLRAAELMRPGDALCFVTSAEWLDNGYGRAPRELLSGNSLSGNSLSGNSLSGNSLLAVTGLWVADSAQPVFADALVSSVVVRADRGGEAQCVRTGVIAEEALHTLHDVSLGQIAASDRWSAWCRPTLAVASTGIDLGELFRITRGQVTGLNAAWVLDRDHDDLPRTLSVASVTRAKELIDDVIASRAGVEQLRRVVSLPPDLDAVPDVHRDAVARFLQRATAMGADQTYIARHRKPWHAVAMRDPPAAFVSYMGRRPPVFRANPWRASFINIAHGLYPRQPMSAATLARLLRHLNRATDLHAGRMYGGGMAKFEPSDIARLRVPQQVLEGDEI